MIGNNASNCSAPHNYMTAALAHDGKAESFQRADASAPETRGSLGTS